MSVWDELEQATYACQGPGLVDDLVKECVRGIEILRSLPRKDLEFAGLLLCQPKPEDGAEVVRRWLQKLKSSIKAALAGGRVLVLKTMHLIHGVRELFPYDETTTLIDVERYLRQCYADTIHDYIAKRTPDLIPDEPIHIDFYEGYPHHGTEPRCLDPETRVVTLSAADTDGVYWWPRTKSINTMRPRMSLFTMHAAVDTSQVEPRSLIIDHRSWSDLGIYIAGREDSRRSRTRQRLPWWGEHEAIQDLFGQRDDNREFVVEPDNESDGVYFCPLPVQRTYPWSEIQIFDEVQRRIDEAERWIQNGPAMFLTQAEMERWSSEILGSIAAQVTPSVRAAFFMPGFSTWRTSSTAHVSLSTRPTIRRILLNRYLNSLTMLLKRKDPRRKDSGTVANFAILLALEVFSVGTANSFWQSARSIALVGVTGHSGLDRWHTSDYRDGSRKKTKEQFGKLSGEGFKKKSEDRFRKK